MKVLVLPDSKEEGHVGALATETVAARGTLAVPAAGHSRRALDADLSQRAVGGEAAAARALHMHYYPIASAFLRKLGARPDELEDACQEVFLQFFRYLPSFRGEAQLKTWLYRLCMTEARRVRRRRRIGAALSALLSREGPQDFLPAAPAGEPAMRQLVLRALDRMTEKHRLVFVLFEMEGIPGKEVAHIVRCPEATVWRRLHDARRIFREVIEPDAAPEGRPA